MGKASFMSSCLWDFAVVEIGGFIVETIAISTGNYNISDDEKAKW